MRPRDRCHLQGVRRYLARHPELRQLYWRQECAGEHPLCGHCYLGAESMYHLLGGRRSGCVPQNMKWEGYQHWFLRCDGRVVDPTVAQFRARPDYRLATGRGFLTRAPSRRAREVIAAVRRGCGRR